MATHTHKKIHQKKKNDFGFFTVVVLIVRWLGSSVRLGFAILSVVGLYVGWCWSCFEHTVWFCFKNTNECWLRQEKIAVSMWLRVFVDSYQCQHMNQWRRMLEKQHPPICNILNTINVIQLTKCTDKSAKGVISFSLSFGDNVM